MNPSYKNRVLPDLVTTNVPEMPFFGLDTIVTRVFMQETAKMMLVRRPMVLKKSFV